MQLVACREDDLRRIASMNKQLIEDEGHENPMTVEQLEERMRGFLASTYRAFLFEEAGQVVGYALVDTARNPPYLRQFFVDRRFRRQGLGTRAFHLLLGELACCAIDIEVLCWNARGIAFWRSLGFEERAIAMRYPRAGRPPAQGSPA